MWHRRGIFDSWLSQCNLGHIRTARCERDRVLLAGELKHSLMINLGIEDVEHKGVSTQNVPQADWMLTINDIGVAELRQWCDAFGWKGLRGVRTGQLGGT